MIGYFYFLLSYDVLIFLTLSFQNYNSWSLSIEFKFLIHFHIEIQTSDRDLFHKQPPINVFMRKKLKKFFQFFTD